MKRIPYEEERMKKRRMRKVGHGGDDECQGQKTFISRKILN